MQQSILRVINEDRCRNVHRIHKAKSLLHSALANQLLHRVSDVHKPAPIWHFEPKLFG